MLHHDRCNTIALEWWLAGKDLVENHAQRIEVGTRTDRSILYLLRRDIKRRPQNATGHRLARRPLQFRQTKIRKNRFTHWVAFRVTRIQQDISRFDVTMNHALLMRIIQCQTNRSKKMHDLRWRGK